MALNITRQELIDGLDAELGKLNDVVDELSEMLTEIEDEENAGEPRRRFEIAEALHNLDKSLAPVANKICRLAREYRKLKNGNVAPAPAAPAVEAKREAGEGEKTFRLSASIRERVYTFPSGDTVRVPSPRKLVVKASGNRELTTATGQRYVIHYPATFADVK